MLLIYNALFLLLAPIWVPMLWWKDRKRVEKVDWKQRQGNFPIVPRTDRKRIWIHAVSVGEVLASQPILERIRSRLPDYEIVLTCTTATGHRTASERLGTLADHIFFFPIDILRFQFAAMERIRPSVVAIMETELWLSFLAMAKQFGATTLLLNGRISDRSFRRSAWVRPFLYATTRLLDRALMQTTVDAERIRAYGAKCVEVFGNSKFDAALESGGMSGDAWRVELGASPQDFVIVVGSTRGAEEEAFVFEALESLDREGLRVVYAPRHMDRVDAIEARARQTFIVGKRSKGESAEFLILDTYGELGSLYAAANVAIIGGGFADLGGQNLIQPLAHGVPVLHGPHMQNFAEATSQALELGASREVRSPAELSSAIQTIRSDGETWLQMVHAAKKLMAENLGASDRYADAVVEAASEFQQVHRQWLDKQLSVESQA